MIGPEIDCQSKTWVAIEKDRACETESPVVSVAVNVIAKFPAVVGVPVRDVPSKVNPAGSVGLTNALDGAATGKSSPHNEARYPLLIAVPLYFRMFWRVVALPKNTKLLDVMKSKGCDVVEIVSV